LKEVCEGVSELHENNIVHRDIKPENIVMCYGMAKICDFGWAAQVKYSMRETFCGTPLYVSPELLKGRLYDEKVDIWAVGILGYEMITGTIPFRIKS
jgi:serine/threonine protein kinase